MLGEKWRFLQPGEHPLGLGCRALDKYIVGTHDLSDVERVAMADLKRSAEIIDGAAQYWVDHRDQFIKDLLTSDRCRTLLFEIEVIASCIYPNVGSYEWPIYREGERDIHASDPGMVVECKLAQKPDIARIVKSARKARSQRSPTGIPLVAAIGFRELVTDHTVTALARSVQDQQRWFQDRPEISAVLILMRTGAPMDGKYWNPLGLPGRIAFFGQLLEVRNQGSRNPLPLSFSFGGTEGSRRLVNTLK
jgi:hypothetical protein